MGKIFLVLGILGLLLGGGITLVSLLLPAITRNVSSSEAAIGAAAGLVVVALSFIPAIVGLIILIVKRKKVQTP